MKACPICAAKAFDDAEVCYGCLYRFERSSGVLRVPDVPDASANRRVHVPIASATDFGEPLCSEAPASSCPSTSVPFSSLRASQPVGVSRGTSALASARPATCLTSADQAAEAPSASVSVQSTGDDVHVEPSGMQGWTVTFELPGVDVVGQDPPVPIADLESAERAGESEIMEGRHGIRRAACNVVVRVAAPPFVERRPECASAPARFVVDRSDVRGTHAREHQSDGLVVSKSVIGGA